MSRRAVLVTGASRGIGRATAQAFATAGDLVAVNYRDSAGEAEEVVQSLPGSGHVSIQADLADPEAAKLLVDATVKALGGLDVLVNNAGISLLHDITDGDFEAWRKAWDRTLAVNLSGPAFVTYWAVQQMLGRGGRIINISSRGAFRGEPDQPAYGASKAGLNAFGQSLARALGFHGIAVMTIAPGWVATDMSRRSPRRPSSSPPPRQSSPAGRCSTSTALPTSAPSGTGPEAQTPAGGRG